jgi:hypothetical protein
MMSDASSRMINSDAAFLPTEGNLKRHNNIGGGGGGYEFGADDSWDRVMGWDERFYN